jgi:4-hydroxy-tetrahydrodipicolinate synthase
MEQAWRGIFAIVTTPFDAAGDLVWEDFDNECDFVARSGAHGLVWPVMASEFTVIATHEKIEGMKRAVDVIAGRVPVVIGVADTSKAGSLALAEAAAKAGADAVIAMPPWETKLSGQALVEAYYRALADAAGLPIMIQNAGPPLGSALPGSFVVDLCRRIPLVQYLKEEKPPQGHSVQEVVDLGKDVVKGVFSGASANYIVPEYRRGVAGNMPACVLPDVDAQIWNALEVGDVSEARRIAAAKAVFENTLGSLPRRRAHKMTLALRGVIAETSTYGRGAAGDALDAVDLAEMEYGLSVVRPFFTV